jgi:quercetin dioxygenase-like cupin family protein
MRLLSIAALAVLCATPAAAQDPAAVAPDSYKVLAENARVRVLRVTMAPGARAATHEHPAHLVVGLQGGTVRTTLPDGTSTEAKIETDGALLAPAGPHATANPGTTPVTGIIVEMKGAPGTATLPATRPGQRATTLAEDARVRVSRVSIDPTFAEPAGTTHDYDQVVITLAPSDISLSLEGKTRATWKRGDVSLIGRGVAHQSKGGAAPSDVVIVAIR